MRGLLWAEWFAHSRMLLSFLLLWLGAAWIVPLFTHPGWIMVISFLYALVAGPSHGGSDAVDDCEEFTFSLPATRSDRFLARLAVSGFTLMMFVGLDFLVLGMDWQSTLKRFFLDAGLLEPAPELKPGLLYGLVMALPINVFCSFQCRASSVYCVYLMVLESGIGAGNTLPRCDCRGVVVA